MLFVSLEHIEVFFVIFSETSETGHVGPWLIWRGMTHVICLEIGWFDMESISI